MCGLVVVVSKTGSVNVSQLEKMNALISHRGPDGEGIYVANELSVGFAHRRLAIVDLDEIANQPFFLGLDQDEAASVIVFNGEIYNHVEIRTELERLGRQFKTSHSDTEVVLQGFEEWGFDRLLARLNGMFSIAILCKRTNMVYVARDRFGIKPLYVWESDEGIYFASEIKSFFGHAAFKPELSCDNLASHLYFRALPAPKTLFKGVESFPPGQYECINLATLERDRAVYWFPGGDNDLPDSTELSHTSVIDELLTSSTQLMSIADVPVGIFLSGGIDSGLIAAKMKERLQKKLSAFTVKYEGPQEYDESLRASQVAKITGADHELVELSERDFIELLSEMTYFLEEPISAPVCIPVMELARAARKKRVPVILAGEGADEVFVGYKSWLRILSASKIRSSIPDWASRILTSFVIVLWGWLAPSRMPRAQDILQRVARGYPIFWGGAWDFSSEELSSLLGRTISTDDIYKDNIKDIYEEFLLRFDSDDHAAWMAYCDSRFRLPALMLPRLDKLCMRSSIEGRVPFLDHRLIDYYLSTNKKLRAGSLKLGKDSIRAIYERYFGHEESAKEKKGFRAPVTDWKSGVFGNTSANIIKEFASRTELFQPDFLDKILEKENDRLYYSLLCFAVWYNQFIEEVLPEYELRFRP